MGVSGGAYTRKTKQNSHPFPPSPLIMSTPYASQLVPRWPDGGLSKGARCIISFSRLKGIQLLDGFD